MIDYKVKLPNYYYHYSSGASNKKEKESYIVANIKKETYSRQLSNKLTIHYNSYCSTAKMEQRDNNKDTNQVSMSSIEPAGTMDRRGGPMERTADFESDAERM